jgi:hypothetical protein
MAFPNHFVSGKLWLVAEHIWRSGKSNKMHETQSSYTSKFKLEVVKFAEEHGGNMAGNLELPSK